MTGNTPAGPEWHQHSIPAPHFPVCWWWTGHVIILSSLLLKQRWQCYHITSLCGELHKIMNVSAQICSHIAILVIPIHALRLLCQLSKWAPQWSLIVLDSGPALHPFHLSQPVSVSPCSSIHTDPMTSKWNSTFPGSGVGVWGSGGQEAAFFCAHPHCPSIQDLTLRIICNISILRHFLSLFVGQNIFVNCSCLVRETCILLSSS